MKNNTKTDEVSEQNANRLNGKLESKVAVFVKLYSPNKYVPIELSVCAIENTIIEQKISISVSNVIVDYHLSFWSARELAESATFNFARPNRVYCLRLYSLRPFKN